MIARVTTVRRRRRLLSVASPAPASTATTRVRRHRERRAEHLGQLQVGEAVGPEGVDANKFDFLA